MNTLSGDINTSLVITLSCGHVFSCLKSNTQLFKPTFDTWKSTHWCHDTDWYTWVSIVLPSTIPCY